MKKIVSFVLGLFITTALQAANTEVARITITGAGGTEASDVTLRVDPSISAVQTSSFVGETEEVGQINMYASYNDEKLSSFKANAISNLPIVLVTNRRDESYTFTFNVPIATVGLTLTDLRSNEGIKNIPMVNNGSYTFSIEDETGYDPDNKSNLTIADRFVINYDPDALKYDIELNGHYLATFSAPENVIIPEGLSAYTADFQGEQFDLLVSKIDGNYIPANTGVILFNQQGGVGSDQKNFSLFKYTGTDQMPSITNNDLKPATAWASVSQEEGTNYVLHDSEMWLYDGANMKKNKAFLHVGIGSGAPQRIRMVFSEEQGIESIAAEGKAVKFVENGRVFIKRGDKVYNLQGQLVK